jgi:hypothetical protein
MALTDDQKAMLRLLAQREEGYDDMAALMGVGVEEVRARVKEALAEVEGVKAPEPTTVPPRAQSSPSSPRRARPALIKAPKLRLPRRKPAGTDNRGALIGVGAGAAVVVVLIVILVVGGSGGGSSSATTSTSKVPSGASVAAAEGGQLTQAILAPSSGGSGSGRALFGRYKKNVLLQVEAEGLEPAPPGETYTVWLYRSPKLVLRVGSAPVSRNGKIAAQFPIPAQILAYIASGAFDQIDLSLTDEAAYKVELAKAKQEKRLPSYTGESVLRGKITGPAIKKQ